MNRRSPTVERVVRGQLCTGCGLCASVSRGAIAMATEAPGFSRPKVTGDISDAAESVIAAACPGAKVAPWDEAPSHHPFWGPWRRIATGYATDEDLRRQASSGGAVTALACHALASGLVDRVVHVVADPVSATRNRVVISRTAIEVVAGAGSRYAASSPLADIDAILAEGGAIAFVGKPCDVSALRQLARQDERVARHIPIMLSFFCAGVPSHAAADRVISAMGLNPAEVVGFRYRGDGWPGKAVATTRDGEAAAMTYAESWGAHLSKQLQFRCKICPDGVGGVADIACADAWYGDDAGYPSFEEQDGRSLIVARTGPGARLLSSALNAGVLAAEDLDVGEIDAMQPSQARRKRLVRSRMAALAATMQPRLDVTGVMTREAAQRAGMKEELKSFLGAARRILSGRR